MKLHKTSLALAAAVLAALLLAPGTGSGANKDMVQLQTQMQAVQDQMARMQQSFDERMGVMKNLVEQNTDNMNKLVTAMGQVQASVQKSANDSAAHSDQLSGQIQALNDSLDELKSRLARVTKQLEDMQNAQQNLNAQQAQQPPAVQAPPPDVLYNNALRDYNSGKSDLAKQEFADYLKYYSNTDQAGSAQFYLAEMEYREGSYQQAAQDYDKVLQQFPSGNLAASAHLKKGLALLELGNRQSGVQELNTVIQRFPRTPEAVQARERLRRLGTSSGRTARKSSAPEPE